MADKTFDKYQKRGAYHWAWYRRDTYGYRSRVDMVLSHLPGSGTALDIGGGDGLITFQMFRRGLDVTCIDTNEFAISLGRRAAEYRIYGPGLLRHPRRLLARAGVGRTGLMRRYEAGELRLEVRSFEDIQPGEMYDVVVCHEVIEHIPEPQRLLETIHSSMRQFAIISTPDVTNRPPHPLDYVTWTPDTFAEFLAGYRYEFILQDGWDMYVKVYK